MALFGGLILSLAGLWAAGSQALSQRPFVWLGEISYSVSMVCIPWKLLFVNAASRALGVPEDALPWPVWLVFLAGVPLPACRITW